VPSPATKRQRVVSLAWPVANVDEACRTPDRARHSAAAITRLT
jgi:hypothetical protein